MLSKKSLLVNFNTEFYCNKLYSCRDLSQHIRDQIKVAFSKGNATQVNQDQCDRYYASLKRLSSNTYGDRYKRRFNSTASGLTHDQCNLALTPELQEEFEKREFTFFEKLSRWWNKP